MFGKSSSKVNQWLERRRPQSAYYPSSSSSKLQISPDNQDESCRNGSTAHSNATLARRAFSLQQHGSGHSNRLASPSQNETNSGSNNNSHPLSIPTRHTSKFYKLDPELQARVDNVLESDQLKQLMDRLQQQKKNQRQSQPPPAVPPHYVC